MEMTQPMQTPSMQALPKALDEGKLSSKQVDDAVRRVLEAKVRLGLFEHPYVDETKVAGIFADPTHLALAQRAAEQSAVLLRNAGALLPLDRRALHSIAVLGPLADSARDALGPWTFPQNKPPASSVLAGIRAKVGSNVRVDYSPGVETPARVYPSPFAQLEKAFAPSAAKLPVDEGVEFPHAVALAKNADVTIMVLGESQEMIGEAASSSSLELPGRQQELLDAVVATGKPVIVLLMTGRPLNLKDTKAAALMDIWYPGSAAGTAVANLLFGDATPGGKLPFSWIRSAAQAPNPYGQLLSFSPGPDKRYWNGSSEPTYPFGYGLSYTTFQYSNLKVAKPSYTPGEPVTVTVDLKNSGARAGEEVAQLYVHQRYGTSSRPVRELKGFQRVALKPGETRTLRFTLGPDALRYWSAATGGWVEDESPFDLWVGGNEAADLAASFDVKRP
jgi:beta-glucosidase